MAQNLVLNVLAKDKTRVAFGAVRRGLTNLKSSIFSVQSAILGIGAGLVAKSFLKVGKDVEQLRLRFFFLFGSVEEGKKAFDTLVKFAGKVPFTLEQIAAASGNLAVVSKDAEELGKNLQIVGNIAAVTGLDFKITGEQVQRTLSAGIASAELFRERGVKEMLGFSAGVSVSSEKSAEALDKVFGPNGRFGKAAEVLGTTFDGTLSMIQDKIFQFQLGTNEAGFFDFIKGGLITINKLAEENQEKLKQWANSLGQGLIRWIENSIVGFIRLLDATKVVFKTIIAGIKGIVDVINFLPPVVREMGILGFLMLGTKGRYIVLALGVIFSAIKKLLKKLGIELDFGFNKGLGETNNKLSKVHDFFARIKTEIELNTIEVKKMQKEVEAINKEAALLKRNISPFRKEIEKLNEESLKKLTDLSKQAFAIFEMGIKGMSKGIAESIVLGKEFGDTMRNIGNQILIKIISALVEVAVKIGVQIALQNTTIAQLLITLGIEKQITAEKDKQNSEANKKAKYQFLSLLMGGGGMASGGTVSKGQPVMVGERGPELFVPNSTGQIQQNARGTGGGSVNVNFNIDAIDSSSFNNVLVENRSIITSIINNALNEKGRRELV